MSQSSSTGPWRFLLRRLAGRRRRLQWLLKQRGVTINKGFNSSTPLKEYTALLGRIYDSWMVLINLWISAGDAFSPAAADVHNMKQLSLECFPLFGFILRLSSVGITEEPLRSITVHSRA